MLISTEISSFRNRLGDDKAVIQLLKNGGFTAYDFSMANANYAFELLKDDSCFDYAKDVRKFSDEIGIVCNQSHAPFPTIRPNDKEYNDRVLTAIKRSIQFSSILGAKICVVHPCNTFSPEENMELYRAILPTARKYGIKIATENMWGYDYSKNIFLPAANSSHDSFKKQMDLLLELDKEIFVACVDIGHCELNGLNTSAVQMLETLGDSVACIHLHDNNKLSDSHSLPFTCNINYEPIITSLKKIKYNGDITLEANSFVSRFPIETIPTCAKLCAEVANWFKNQLEK